MKFLLSFFTLAVFTASSLNACKDDTLCSTFIKESFDAYCIGFLKVPCPFTCGKCASDNLQAKFQAAFRSDAQGNVHFEEGLGLLRILNINSDDAFITELKDLIFDSKISFTDLYQMMDADKNGELSIPEFFNGAVKFLESLGINFMPEMKTNMAIVADIAKMTLGNKNDMVIPKLNDVLQSLMTKLDAVPHGLVTMVKLQNLNMTRHLDLARIIVPSGNSYTINAKALIWDILDSIDLDDDGLVTLRELLGHVFIKLNLFSVTVPLEVHTNVNRYLDLVDQSNEALLKKYGFTDISQLNDKILPELGNQKFVDYRIKIHEAAMTSKTFLSAEVMKYMKTISNSLPQKKLTMKSIKEALFVTLDKNLDFGVSMDEISTFALSTLTRIGANLKDMAELTKVFKLFDVDFNGKLDMMGKFRSAALAQHISSSNTLSPSEFLEMFKKPQA